MENSAVFLSYEMSDYDHLKSFLFKTKDYRVYSVKAARLPGQQGLAEDTVQAIKHCHLFVVCLSQKYAATSECMLEVEYASNIRKKIILVSLVFFVSDLLSILITHNPIHSNQMILKIKSLNFHNC